VGGGYIAAWLVKIAGVQALQGAASSKPTSQQEY
jgi:hypothetical protein